MKAEKTRSHIRWLNYTVFADCRTNKSVETELKEIERLAEIGRYTEMAFDYGYRIEKSWISILDTRLLIAWGKEQEDK